VLLTKEGGLPAPIGLSWKRRVKDSVRLSERKARELVIHMLRSRITATTALCFRRRLRAMVVCCTVM
jgi:hypothetical protein